MNKLVLELTLADPNSKLFRSTGIRIFDQRSLTATYRLIVAKGFGLLSKRRFYVRIVSDVNSADRMTRRFLRESSGELLMPLLDKTTQVVDSFGAIDRSPFNIGAGDIRDTSGVVVKATTYWHIRDEIAHLFYDQSY
jgi:hypothetical protein